MSIPSFLSSLPQNLCSQLYLPSKKLGYALFVVIVACLLLFSGHYRMALNGADVTDVIPPLREFYNGDSEWPDLNRFCNDTDYAAFRGENLASPKAAFVSSGNMENAHISIGIPGVVCVVVALPPPPEPTTNHTELPGYPADSLLLTVQSSDIIYHLHVQPVPGHNHTYAAPAIILHEGQYTLYATIEYRNYEWNTEPPHPFPVWSPIEIPTNTSVTASHDLLANVVLPTDHACGPLTDMHGRWVKAERFRKENPLDLWASPETEDDFGYLFVPDRCRPKYYSPDEQLSCLRDRVIHAYGDSNIRRAFKSLSTRTEWCKDGGGCNCDDDDGVQLDSPWATNHMTPLLIPDKNATIYLNFIGGLVKQKEPWTDLLKSSIPPADLVFVTLGTWDSAYVTFPEYESALKKFVVALRHRYPTQPLILRVPQPICCSVMFERYFTYMRVKAFHDATLRAFKGLAAVIWDVSVLNGRRDLYALKDCENQVNHARHKIVRIENQLLANGLCGGAFA